MDSWRAYVCEILEDENSIDLYHDPLADPMVPSSNWHVTYLDWKYVRVNSIGCRDEFVWMSQRSLQA